MNRIGRIPIALAVNGNYTFESFIISKDVELKQNIVKMWSYVVKLSAQCAKIAPNVSKIFPDKCV